MSDATVQPLPFHPSQILQWTEGYVAIGVDGDFLLLDHKLNQKGEPKKPFPSSVKKAVVVQNRLIATWIEHELMVARIAGFELGTDFVNGPERGDLRTRTTIAAALHPAGTVWSHVLDAEPLALGSNDSQFAFMLWRKGLYAMGMDAGEHWRSAEPNWEELGKLPHAEVTTEITFERNSLKVWSRGSGVKTYDAESGKQIDSMTVPFEGILNSVFSNNGEYLLCYDGGDVVWFSNGEVKKIEHLNGAVQHAKWNEKLQHWHIAGWREECVLTLDSTQRAQLEEIPVQIIECMDHFYLVLNNGHFMRSSL